MGGREPHRDRVGFFPRHLIGHCLAIPCKKPLMNLKHKIKEAGAAGYILLWLLGIPIPILLIIFLVRGCT